MCSPAGYRHHCSITTSFLIAPRIMYKRRVVELCPIVTPLWYVLLHGRRKTARCGAAQKTPKTFAFERNVILTHPVSAFVNLRFLTKNASIYMHTSNICKDLADVWFISQNCKFLLQYGSLISVKP